MNKTNKQMLCDSSTTRKDEQIYNQIKAIQNFLLKTKNNNKKTP